MSPHPEPLLPPLSPPCLSGLPIGDEQLDFARSIRADLERLGMRVSVDARNEKIGYKIRAAQLEKVPFMLVIGEKEMADGTVSVRSRKKGDMGLMSVADFTAFAKQQIDDLVLDN